MGAESQLRRLGGRKQKNSPPILSHEFVIQNHADIMSCLAMIFVAGLMFKATQPIASMFVTLQNNLTIDSQATEKLWVYESGKKDAATIFFYSIICIIVHAVVQEYIIDKLKSRVHLSKTKTAKFSESGQLSVFCLLSTIAAVYIIAKENYFSKISMLWEDYPNSHTKMSFFLKFFFIIQISYWLHSFPEFYLQKVKKEDIRSRGLYSFLYLATILGAYVLNFTRVSICMLAVHYAAETVFHIARLTHFVEKVPFAKHLWRAWNVAFVLSRLGCVTLAVLVFWYGLRLSEITHINMATGNFNTAFVRLNCLLGICAVQCWLGWNFICAWLRRARDRAPSSKRPPRYDLRSQKKAARRQHDEDLRSLPEADQHDRQLRARKTASPTGSIPQ